MGWMHCWGRRWPVSSLAQTWTLFSTWKWSSASWTWRTSRSLKFLPQSPKSQAIMTLFMTATNSLSLDWLIFRKCILKERLLQKVKEMEKKTENSFLLKLGSLIRLITMDLLNLMDLACKAYEPSGLVEEPPHTGPQVLNHSSPVAVISSHLFKQLHSSNKPTFSG